MTQPEALTILKTGANVFLTGEPGSGKTHTINQYSKWLRSCGIEPSITAATGIAATHVGGMTLHSWSGIQVHESLSAADIDRIASKEHIARRILKAKVLIIEEVSMLSASVFEMADQVCREVRRDSRPFGGLTVVLVGDFFQLPPVSRNKTAEFAYTSRVWKELNPIVCYLTEQFRQDDDEFLSVLTAIRSGEVEELHYEHLLSRVTSEPQKDLPKLFSHNADVDRINTEELEKLPGKATKFLMHTKGKESLVEGLKRGCLSPEVLELKEGAAVMFTKNSPQGKFVNGTLGLVTDFDREGLPLVTTKDGRTVTADAMEWQLEEHGKVLASISQVPLRLAYAMTVHKSQGMSMDAAQIDLGKAFEYGQGYVALSRLRRLSGLYLIGLNERALQVHPQILEVDISFREASGTASSMFSQMTDAEKVELEEKFVKAMGGAIVENGIENGEDTTGMPGRLAETLQAVRRAKTLTDAARDRGLSVSTVVKHLEELADLGKLTNTDFTHLVAQDAVFEIKETVDAAESDRLSPIFHALNGRHSFETIRLVRLMR
jgi:ATP-dependent DNA helicase PIF1